MSFFSRLVSPFVATLEGMLLGVDFSSVDAGILLCCVSNLEYVQAGSILSIKAGDCWLAVGASKHHVTLLLSSALEFALNSTS